MTGGGAGIGAAIAEAVGRTGAYVVTVDPGVTVDGLAQDEAPAETTADRIVAAGGAARASNASVTDAAAIDALFTGLVDEFGGLDAVINVAGISRPTGYAEGDEPAWASVLSVHLDGYLNVLRSALPIMAAAGRGRILGVTSGSGWRPANAGAYSCAKRAVAALTWQLGRVAPAGVTVNALSPIAATRHGDVGPAPAGLGGRRRRPEPDRRPLARPRRHADTRAARPGRRVPRQRGVLVELREHHLLQRFGGGTGRAAAAARGGPNHRRRGARPRARHRDPGGVRAGRSHAGHERRQQRSVHGRVRRDRRSARVRGERRRVVPGRRRRPAVGVGVA